MNREEAFDVSVDTLNGFGISDRHLLWSYQTLVTYLLGHISESDEYKKLINEMKHAPQHIKNTFHIYENLKNETGRF